MNETKRCFAPVVDPQTRVLILGSLPGEASLAASQYYAHPQNRFWELVGALIGVDLRALAYEARLEALRRHGIGLWDVIAEAQRRGSLDAAIRHERHNGLLALMQSLPALHTVAFNGGTAARHGLKQLGEAATAYRILSLPSSSPAHTLAFAHKLAAWQQLAMPES